MADLFKEMIPSILKTKQSVLTEENKKEYVPYLVNKALSYHRDCVMAANMMNRFPSTDRKMQYDYLFNTVRAYKRPFIKWHKPEEDENVAAICEYYKYSVEKAKYVLPLLSDDQINDIKNVLKRGGLNQ